MAGKKTFSNSDIAELLNKVAVSYEILKYEPFRIAAYQRASVSAEHCTMSINDLWKNGQLDQIPGFGKNISAYIDEFFKKGRVEHFEKIFKKIPSPVFEFIKIPGIGPKNAYFLAINLNILSNKNSIVRLKKMAQEGKIRNLKNFGEKSEKEILKGIVYFEKNKTKKKRMLLFYADQLADEIIEYLKKSKYILEADKLGSLRRRMATVGDIDISVSTSNPAKAIEYAISFPKIKEVIEKGEQKLIRVVLFSGLQVDIRFSFPEKYGSMLQYFTGSKQHNINLREMSLKQGLSLSEHGIKTTGKIQNSKCKIQNYNSKLKIYEFAEEKDFYSALGLEWIPPELREGTGEIDSAKNHNLPKLIEVSDIKGDLHMHCDFQIEPSHDLGESSAREMIIEAGEMGYEYIGFSEHNPSESKHSLSQISDLIKRKKEYIEQEYYSLQNNKIKRTINLPKKILNGLEIDIKVDGSLPVDEKSLAILDYAICSVHSSFNLNKTDMTKRIIAGLSHPKVLFLGHPSGRLLEEREGYELDWDKLFDFCVKNHKYLEISSWPNRLDLPDIKVREALKYGVKFVVNSDAHDVGQMKFIPYGISVCKRGWLEKQSVINTLNYSKLNDIIFK